MEDPQCYLTGNVFCKIRYKCKSLYSGCQVRKYAPRDLLNDYNKSVFLFPVLLQIKLLI